MTRLSVGATLTLVSLLVAGCGVFRTDAHVRSDTSWSGSFDGTTVDGKGNQIISLGYGSGPKCASVQKQTTGGFLTVEIDSGEEKTTTASYGVVTVCGG